MQQRKESRAEFQPKPQLDPGEASVHGERHMKLGTESGYRVCPAQFPADGH